MSNRHNEQFKRNLDDLIGQFYPQVNLRIIFSNNHTIASMFPFKDVIPDALKVILSINTRVGCATPPILVKLLAILRQGFLSIWAYLLELLNL